MKFGKVDLILEGYNFTTPDEVISAIKSNQVGVKIDPSYKELANTFSNRFKTTLRIYFNKCRELGIKDTTYGIQLILSKTNCRSIIDAGFWEDGSMYELVINSDGLYEFLKSYKKPWVKELPEYKKLMEKFTPNNLHGFEKAVQAEQANHGKSAKGSGQLKDVKVAYDDGTWKLLIPSSFEGEKAAAYYNENGVEKTTHWCTRADKYYYDHYTKDAPLYIIRNMKTGKAYQMAFTKEEIYEGRKIDGSRMKVHFLDQNDNKGDEITQGDLKPIPNELLNHIPIPGKNRTMANYNTDKAKPSPYANEKGYIKTGQQSWGKEQIIDKKYQRKVCEFLDDLNRDKGYGTFNLLDKYGERDIVKIVSNKDYFKEKERDPLSRYANEGKKIEDNYQPKARKIRYYFLGHPKEYIEVIASNKAGIKPALNVSTAESWDRSVLQYTAFYEMGVGIPKKQIRGFISVSKSSLKARERRDAVHEKERKFEKIIKDYAESIGAKELGINTESISNEELKYRTQPKSAIKDIRKLSDTGVVAVWRGGSVGKDWSFDGDITNSKFAIELVNGRKIPNKRFFIKVKCNEMPTNKNNIHLVDMSGLFGEIPEEYKEFAFKVSKKRFETWRKMFHDEIIQNRAEGNYKKNMYEEVRNKYIKLITG